VIANIPQTSSSGSSKQADNSTVSISDCSSGNNFETYYNKKFLNSTTTNSIISFPDINDSFAVNDIKMLAKYKIIKGYADGNFKPNFGTSRAEFLSTVMKSLGIKINSGITTDFTDMPSDGGQAKYIAKAQELGIAQGQVIDGKLKFRPNDLITRAEAIYMLLNASQIKPSENANTNFTDIPANGTWMIKYIAKAQELGIAQGQVIDGKLKFRPNSGISRAETAKIIKKTLVYLVCK
ncbi:MAG: S-layer homology domain-containing protein, partial [Candidatus Gracilibacteria bacterium]|nr:S-layer homology domain-containing protein [Candidatus Gracilibacteria bacterium]